MATTASAERRNPTAPRRTFKTTVDLTPGDERDAWQADAIEVSPRGMSMRAPVLPEVGEMLGVRIQPEEGPAISAQAEVVWATDHGRHAGSFGVCFTDVSPQAERSLRRMLESQDDVMVDDRPAPPPVDSRVKLFIHGMDAPLRAKVRASDPGEVIVGSELSFLKLGDKVDVDGAGAKVTGSIVEVDVEVDPKSRVPRLVLTIDLTGERKPELGGASAARAEAPRAEAPRAEAPRAEAPRAEAPRAEASSKATAKTTVKVAAKVAGAAPVKTAIVSDEPPVEAPAERPAPTGRAAPATNVIGGDEALAEDGLPEAEASAHDSAPGWITQGMGVVRRAGEKAAPVMQRAVGAVGALAQRIRDRKGARPAASEEADVPAPSARHKLRPQHQAATAASAATASSSGEGDALVTQPGRTRKLGLYAGVGLVVAAGIVAYASTSGPKVETPRPQVAVAPESTDPNAASATTATTADPNAAATGSVDPNGAAAAPVDPNAVAPEGQGEPSAAPSPEPRVVPGRSPRSTDLAAAAGAPGELEQPVFQAPPARAPRPAAPRAAAPSYLPPGFATPAAMGYAPRPVMPAAAPRPAPAPALAQAPARPAVFGNPAVRQGTVLRLRMDGPIATIQGAGARGAAIVMTVPGRHSLDLAAPLVQVDPRIAGAGVMNRAVGAELTLRFREPAPPFVARSRGNVLEIVLAPTPGQPVRAAARAPSFRTARR